MVRCIVSELVRVLNFYNSHFKMLYDGSISFLANYLYVFSLYTQTVMFSLGSALIVNLNFGLVTQTQNRRICCFSRLDN